MGLTESLTSTVQPPYPLQVQQSNPLQVEQQTVRPSDVSQYQAGRIREEDVQRVIQQHQYRSAYDNPEATAQFLRDRAGPTTSEDDRTPDSQRFTESQYTNPNAGAQWSSRDNEQLMNLVRRHGKNWYKIKVDLQDPWKDAVDCEQQYNFISRQVPWTDEETDFLVKERERLIERGHLVNYEEISKSLGFVHDANRCQQRYHSLASTREQLDKERRERKEERNAKPLLIGPWSREDLKMVDQFIIAQRQPSTFARETGRPIEEVEKKFGEARDRKIAKEARQGGVKPKPQPWSTLEIESLDQMIKARKYLKTIAEDFDRDSDEVAEKMKERKASGVKAEPKRRRKGGKR